MTEQQKDRLSWMLADLCAASVALGKVIFPRGQMFKDISKVQDERMTRVMNYVDEITS